MAIFCVFLVIFAGFISAVFLSFKTSYLKEVQLASQKNGIDCATIFSIIKAESKFNQNAMSSAGAIGLMQIRLSSAQYISATDKTTLSENDLFVPEKNIMLGTKYFAYLVQKFKDKDVAICAYNAGETIVRSWLSSNEYSSDGKTLFNIPYKETKNYLKKVNLNYKVYKRIFKSL